MPDFQGLTKLIVKHALVAGFANPEKLFGKRLQLPDADVTISRPELKRRSELDRAHRQNCGREVGELAHFWPAVSWIVLDYLKR
jgi:hypothetical protein